MSEDARGDPTGSSRPDSPSGGGVLTATLGLAAAVALLAVGPEYVGEHPGLLWAIPPAVGYVLVRRLGRGRQALPLAAGALLIAVTELTGVLPAGTVEWGLLGTVSVLLTGASAYRLRLAGGAPSGGAPTAGTAAPATEPLPPLEIREGEIRESDPLTRLLRRPVLELFLESQVAAARRGHDLCVVLFHLEGFRDFTDAHGQESGRQLLRKVGEVLKNSARDMDVTGRYGEHEFLALLLGEKPAGARIFANRIRNEVNDLSVELPDGRVVDSPVRASAGIAAFEERMDSASELVETADMALRMALDQGGDRTAAAPEGDR